MSWPDVSRQSRFVIGASEVLTEAVAGARLLLRLPPLLRSPWARTAPRAELQQRLERREDDFLGLVRRAVYEQPSSPYRQLLAHAGCEYGDLERLVTRSGLEAALRHLVREGVYVTVDEFKGVSPAVRGGLAIELSPDRLRNPLSTAHIRGESGGSRGVRTPVGIDLASIRDHAVNLALFLDAWGAEPRRQALWGVPGSSAMRIMLRFAVAGDPLERWFSQIDPAAPGLHPRYRWASRVTTWTGRLAGVPVPAPRHVSLEDPEPVLDWMSGVLQAGATPLLFTFVSSALRASDTARATGRSLAGARFWITGEPVTRARVAAIRSSGATVASHYGSSETAGPIAYGCLNPATVETLHVLSDLHAVVQPGPGTSLPEDALLITSLRESGPFVCLNLSIGDRGTIADATCGCPLRDLGWTTQLRGLRSHEKLTGHGMTFFAAEVLRVLEEVLPTRFGGGPADYQLLEEQADDGAPQLRLLVHPRLGHLDPATVGQAFIDGLGRGDGVERVMAMVWQDARLLHVERRPPVLTASGKIRRA
ncbi:MAG TPA: hypothetical protein VMS64_24425 [Candidatus Methylomirabilis sp.]|nr:hypothetical protein [Candidatus Methylomirabilis sp.]